MRLQRWREKKDHHGSRRRKIYKCIYYGLSKQHSKKSMNFDYQKLEKELSQLLAAMTSFTPSEVAEVQQFLAVGEYGVAFETLCSIVKGESKPVSSEISLKVRELGKQMKIDPVWWTEIGESN